MLRLLNFPRQILPFAPPPEDRSSKKQDHQNIGDAGNHHEDSEKAVEILAVIAVASGHGLDPVASGERERHEKANRPLHLGLA